MSLISNMGRILDSPTPPDKVFLPTFRLCMSRNQAVEPGPKLREYRPFFDTVPNQRVLCHAPSAVFQGTASLPRNHPGTVIYWPGRRRWGNVPRKCEVYAKADPG